MIYNQFILDVSGELPEVIRVHKAQQLDSFLDIYQLLSGAVEWLIWHSEDDSEISEYLDHLHQTFELYKRPELCDILIEPVYALCSTIKYWLEALKLYEGEQLNFHFNGFVGESAIVIKRSITNVAV
jgi:hypothetical protein